VLDGIPVGDGALTNPFAHATATALRVDGSDHAGQVESVQVELYRAHAIETDDTASARVTTARGTAITVAVTLCAATSSDPYVIVHGTTGRATLFYTRDELRIETAAGVTTSFHSRTNLLDNLIAHIANPNVALLVPPERTGAFMQVMEAVRLAPEPVAIPPACQDVIDPGPVERRIVRGIDDAVHASAERVRTFSELGLAWAVPAESPGALR
jgi:predicted dehydrogenase